MAASSDINYPEVSSGALTLNEQGIEEAFIGKLRDLKYIHRPEIRDRASLEKNFREKFEALNRVNLTDAEFARLLEEIVTADVFAASRTLRDRNSFVRDDGTPLNFTLVNIKDWCKNTFEVINQLRINTDNSHQRYDVILLINGVPVVQIELKTLGIHPRRAMEQIVDYKNDPGNGYTKTLLCFLQLFIVSNRDSTYYFANNNARHFTFNQDERFLPIYQFADEANKKITHLDDFAATFLVKCTLGHTISRYMVLIASEQKLMIMRPYRMACSSVVALKNASARNFSPTATLIPSLACPRTSFTPPAFRSASSYSKSARSPTTCFSSMPPNILRKANARIAYGKKILRRSSKPTKPVRRRTDIPAAWRWMRLRRMTST